MTLLQTIITVALSFYCGWRFGRNRAMKDLTIIAESVNLSANEKIEDGEPEAALGMISVNRRFLLAIKEL